jgi:hypothetical protein
MYIVEVRQHGQQLFIKLSMSESPGTSPDLAELFSNKFTPILNKLTHNW